MHNVVKKCLKFSISKDETRVHLNGVYFNSEEKEAVSTDGYILTVSKTLYENSFADYIVDFENMTVINREYLNYKPVIPNKFEHNLDISIPKQDPIIKGKNQREYRLYILKDGKIEISKEPSQDYLVALNPHFFKPLQGCTVKVGINGQLNPIKVELIENDSYYIIMPLRA